MTTNQLLPTSSRITVALCSVIGAAPGAFLGAIAVGGSAVAWMLIGIGSINNPAARVPSVESLARFEAYLTAVATVLMLFGSYLMVRLYRWFDPAAAGVSPELLASATTLSAIPSVWLLIATPVAEFLPALSAVIVVPVAGMWLGACVATLPRIDRIPFPVWLTVFAAIVLATSSIVNQTILADTGERLADTPAAPTPLMLWTTPVDVTPRLIAVGRDDQLFHDDGRGRLHARSASGDTLWVRDGAGAAVRFTRGVVMDATLYTFADDALWAVDVATGERKWTYAPIELRSDTDVLAAHRGTIYVSIGAPTPSLRAIAADGTEKWRVDEAVTAVGVRTDGVLYVVAPPVLTGYSADERRLWSVETGETSAPFFGRNGLARVARRDGLMFFGLGGDSTFVPLTLNAKPLLTPVITRDGTIYVADTKLYALDPFGAVEWTWQPGRTRVFRPPLAFAPLVAANGTVVVVDTRGAIYGITPAGTPQWDSRRYAVADRAIREVAIGAGTVVYVRSDQDIAALELPGQ